MPTTFTDLKGREWKLTFTAASVKPLTEVLGHPPKEALTDAGKLAGLIGGPEKLIAVTHVLAGVPAEVTDLEFAAGFDSEALERVAEAVVTEFSAFYARGQKGKAAAAKIVEALRRADEKTATAITASPIELGEPTTA